MGIYLSTPSTDIELEEGSGKAVRYIVGEMQVIYRISAIGFALHGRELVLLVTFSKNL